MPKTPALFVTLLLAACTSNDPILQPADSTLRPPRTVAAAQDLDFTETFEVVVRGEIIGYVQELLELPEGIEDRRAWPAGTMLVQDLDRTWIGFVSPRGAAYRFDERGEAQPVGAGSKLGSVGRMFGRPDIPVLRTITPELDA